jgi:hypothetical protein
MGEMTGTDNFAQGEKLAADTAVTTPEIPAADSGNEPTGVVTDVDGVFADGERGGVPVFKVTQKEFYDNMKMDRKRLRLKNGSPAQKYYSQSKYRRPFWIQDTESGDLRKFK